MASIGGRVTNSTTPAGWSLPDPWQQGIGVFDLTAMEWKEGYDSGAAPYVTPDAVKTYYQQNGLYPASWNNDVVKAWFTKTESNNTASNISNSTTFPTSRPGPSGSNAGAIAGGVVGGVVALVLIIVLVLFLLRRRSRKGHLAVPMSDSEYRKPELGDSRMPIANHPPSEMQGVNDSAEMPQKEVATSELPTWEQPKEAAGSTLFEI